MKSTVTAAENQMASNTLPLQIPSEKTLFMDIYSSGKKIVPDLIWTLHWAFNSSIEE